jgi:hypothetical protein
MLTTRVVSDHEATDRLIAFCDRHDRHRAKHGETVSFWRKQNFFALDDPSLFPDVFESAAWPIANDLFLWAVRLGRTQVISALKLFASQTAVYAARYMTHTPVDQERLFKAIRGIPHVAQPVFLACLVFCPEYVTHVWTHHMPDYAWEAIRRNDACIVRGEGRPVSSLKVPVNPQVMRDGMIVSARHLYMPAHEYYHRHAAVNHRFDCVMDTLACKITKAIEPTCYGTVDATHSRRDAKGVRIALVATIMSYLVLNPSLSVYSFILILPR